MGAQQAIAETIQRRFPGVVVSRGLRSPVSRPLGWDLEALRGSLSELSAERARATLTLAFELVYEAQGRGEPVAFCGHPDRLFFPPDVAAAGVDLEAVVVVRVADVVKRLRAAVHLARSGAFGLLLIDLEARDRVPAAALTALVGHAQQHGMAVVFLTDKNRGHPSVGSLIRVRAEGVRQKVSGDERYLCQVEILKDKRRGPGFSRREAYRGPVGLC